MIIYFSIIIIINTEKPKIEVLKYYIDTQTYRNVITVNKEWYAIVKDMSGPIMFQTLMKRYGWIDYYYKHKSLIESLTPLEIIDCMLETIDDTKPYLFKKMLNIID